MLDELNSVLGFLFGTMSSIVALYLSGSILTGVFAIWLVRKISTLFDKIR